MRGVEGWILNCCGINIGKVCISLELFMIQYSTKKCVKENGLLNLVVLFLTIKIVPPPTKFTEF